MAKSGLFMNESNSLYRLWQILVLEKKEVTSIYFFAILSGLVQLSLPLGVQTIIGLMLGATMVTSIYILIFVVVLGVLVVGLMQINQMRIIEKIQQRIFTRYAFAFAEKFPQIHLHEINDVYLPEKANRFFDAITLQKGLSKILLDLPIASIQIVFGLSLLTLYHPVFIIFGGLLVLVLWMILKYTGKTGMYTSLKESSYKYAVVSWLEEISRVALPFKYSRESFLNLGHTDKNVVGYLTARTAHFKVLMTQYKTLVVFKVIITSTMLIVGTILVIEQQINIGEFIAAEIVILTIIGAVEKMISSLDSVYDVITGLDKLAQVTDLPIEKSGAMTYADKKEGMELELIDVNYHYGERALLNQLNFKIPANSKVAISGSNGSGKSTFLRFLAGCYQNFNGNYNINGIPLANFQTESLRKKIGLLVDHKDIFLGTVYENITLGRVDIKHDDIMQLAEDLGMHGFLNHFKEGFDTLLQPTGITYSESILQKLQLLRVFAHKPNLLLLDEPFAGLGKSEKMGVINYLNGLKNTTIVVINNDADFVKLCNYTITMNKGTVNLHQA